MGTETNAPVGTGESSSARSEETRLHTRRIAALIVALMVAAYAAGVTYVVYRFQAQLRVEAATYADLVVTVREWNALHGGVWVPKGPGVESNRYLESLGVEPDLVLEDGRSLTLRNPSIMTKEIAGLSREKTGVTFRLVSDRPVNPENTADDWEMIALERLGRGERSVSRLIITPDTRVFRYIEPLYVDETCLGCHGAGGYRVGDIRGGITVDIPLRSAGGLVVRDLGVLGLAAGGAMVFGLALSRTLHDRHTDRIDALVAEVERMASTDALTGLANRWVAIKRLAEEVERSRRRGQPLAIIVLDLDRFKTVNDTYGHGVGDQVLRLMSSRISEVVREYDVVARVGGEEFLVIAPDTGRADAAALAERIRDAVGSQPVDVDSSVDALHVTVSGGVAILEDADRGPDDLLRRGDDALYRAKEQGRDRVEQAE